MGTDGRVVAAREVGSRLGKRLKGGAWGRRSGEGDSGPRELALLGTQILGGV